MFFKLRTLYINNHYNYTTYQLPIIITYELLKWLLYLQCSEAGRRDERQSPSAEVNRDGVLSERETEDDIRYKDLGDIEPNDLISFAYQIAIGMVKVHNICTYM